MEGVDIRKKLPLELAYAFIGNNRQTMDLVKGICYFTVKENTKEFYAIKRIMDPATFNTVNWDNLCNTLAPKPKIYQLWFRK